MSEQLQNPYAAPREPAVAPPSRRFAWRKAPAIILALLGAGGAALMLIVIVLIIVGAQKSSRGLNVNRVAGFFLDVGSLTAWAFTGAYSCWRGRWILLALSLFPLALFLLWGFTLW